MRWQLGMGLIAAGGLILLPLACSWGEEFHACEAERCGTTSSGGLGGNGGTGGTSGPGGGGGSGGGTSAGSSTVTTGDGGTTGASGSTGAGGEAGESGAAGAGGSPPACDGELRPADDMCVVDEVFGVFVSPRGDDATGDGTRQAPFATLQKGADAASETGKRVYACATAGDYVGALSLSEQHDEIELYGSFECSDWSYDAALRAAVAPVDGVAVTVSEIATSLAIEGFSFESADATARGTSSIAAEIRTSFGVLLRNVALRAGAGATGNSGATGKFTHPGQGKLNGVDGTEEFGGVMSAVVCPAGDETLGGAGGFLDPEFEVINKGAAGLPNHDGPGGEGGVGSDIDCIGQDGADGVAGADGAGATSRGVLENGSWLPAGGTDGLPGSSGQGGGGGASGFGGGGGSGGAGTCGLAGGGAGGGGGASIALLLLDAELRLVDAVVTAGNGGAGGPGGQAEHRNNTPGSPGEGFNDACDGGRGGEGGSGGGGGGGAGGISVGILYQGAPPVRTNTTVTAGVKGAGGGGGGADNDGVAGFAERELDVADV